MALPAASIPSHGHGASALLGPATSRMGRACSRAGSGSHPGLLPLTALHRDLHRLCQECELVAQTSHLMISKCSR